MRSIHLLAFSPALGALAGSVISTPLEHSPSHPCPNHSHKEASKRLLLHRQAPSSSIPTGWSFINCYTNNFRAPTLDNGIIASDPSLTTNQCIL